MNGIDAILRLAPVIPVLTVASIEDAAPLAQALVAGGLPVLEVTLRTPAALDAIRAMREVAGARVGAGTVLSGADIEKAFAAGAEFFVSPGLTDSIAERAAELGEPLLPGVATASDIMRGLELGLTRFKIFPAAPAGGPTLVHAFAGPFPNVAFCPTGGVTLESAPTYLSLPNVACVGGTWIAPPDLIAAGAWDEIRRRAAAAAALR
jgi:2-dehydro-3-deoxyphosphogluconate aldolase/(4S)-4-hydroxy-2-oxoglutarate aldolase